MAKIRICGTCMGRGWAPGNGIDKRDHAGRFVGSHDAKNIRECPDCYTPWSGFANVTPEEARQAEIDCMKESA